MPGYPLPTGRNAGLPIFWNSILQALQQHSQQIAALYAGSTQGNLIDGYGNTIEVAGTNISQVVTIGASFGQAGVLVGTTLTGAGRATQRGLVTTTITTFAGSMAATVASGSGLSMGMAIGAADVSDPSSGVATPAIVPGTTISSITGTSVTLSQNAAESGTGLFCAACKWELLSSI